MFDFIKADGKRQVDVCRLPFAVNVILNLSIENKQHCGKVQLKSFYFNGHSLGFFNSLKN